MQGGTSDLRKRLASWVAEKISGKRYAELADVSIDALQGELLARRALVKVACWCDSCDKEANAGFRTRMGVCPDCGDKRCNRAQHHDNACSTAPHRTVSAS